MAKGFQVWVPVLAALLCIGSSSSQGQPAPGAGSDFVVSTYTRRPDSLQEEPGLSAAIADLREAVVRRDVELIEPWLANRVHWGEGREPKAVVLAEMRKWTEEEWDNLGRSLRLGAAMLSPASAILPFTVEALSEGDTLDGVEFGVLAAAEESAAVHVSPDSASAVLDTVQRALLVLDDHRDSSQPWARIRSPQGHTGYILWSALSGTPYGETVWFERSEIGWQIVAFGLDC
jgi:hypothetical protein